MNILKRKLKCPVCNVNLCFVLFCFVSFLIIFINNEKFINHTDTEVFYEEYVFREVVDKFYERRMNWKTSNLGKILFQNATLKDLNIESRNNRVYVILIWSHFDWLRDRHVVGFQKTRSSPFDDCSVKNCLLSGSDDDLNTADAVVVHIQKGIIPKSTARKREQRWVFLTDESPINSFSLSARKPDISELANVFNWSASYRSISDIPVPYGRTIPLPKPLVEKISSSKLENLIPNFDLKQSEVLVTIMMSNCLKDRMKFVDDLNQFLQIDGYGSCFENNKKVANKECPGHFRSDCPTMSKYLFYLVLENSLCDEYLTEKSFYHAYSKGAIPIIKGPRKDVCDQLLPPNSYLHVDDYPSLEDLAQKILAISEDRNKILEYHLWRNYFEVRNEHGYFDSKSQHYCRICEALHYNDRSEKIYSAEDLKPYFDPQYSCR